MTREEAYKLAGPLTTIAFCAVLFGGIALAVAVDIRNAQACDAARGVLIKDAIGRHVCVPSVPPVADNRR